MELMMVLAIMGVLAVLILAGVLSARGQARAALCENNFRQLITAWELYSVDHLGRLVSNVHLDLTVGWVRGSVLGVGGTNTRFLIDREGALFAPYIKTPEIYRCPADESVTEIERVRYPRVRSVSMNQAMGYESYAIWLPSRALARPAQRAYVVYRLASDIESPASRFVFADESEVTINDPAFAVEMPQPTRSGRWVDVPATRHSGSGVLAFADGHVETHRWIDPLTSTSHFDTPASENADWVWLTERTSRPIE